MDFGLIGETLDHSYSAEIHQRLRGYDYRLCPMPPEALPAFFAARDFRGINVTIPYKRAVMLYCDALDETARRIGSVNTVIRQPDGRLTGYNTDLAGFRTMLSAAGISLAGRRVMILGSGGTAQTAKAAAADAGAAKVTVVSRGGEVNYETCAERCPDTEVILNTTPVGMFPRSDARPLDLSAFPCCGAVADAIYHPLRTRLLQQAEELGMRCAGGLRMLTAQAKAAGDLFTGAPQPDERAEAVYRSLRGELTNWVLIGMPGCGKSTVGAALAWRSGRPFVDLDELAEERAGMPAAELIRQEGEGAFRDLEEALIREVGARTGQVIATGGGAVLREGNVFALRQNGKLLWIRRELRHLAREGRPLSSGDEALARMAERRVPLYERAADGSVEHGEDWDGLANAAWDWFTAESERKGDGT
ncbi:MAG: shikimate dehydrogenase [Oscillospiraceae bacterium]|jgi:shikimate dehydrogenase|nr:shikimate dehydrogenase [Oscillospiraceae bacterium]